MSELAKSYEHSEIEHKWLSKWEESKCFVVDNPLEADFKIAFPPPNVTGELHMGHALNSTLQDTLIRYHRMLGKKVHWQVGSDHAGIGTQIVVEKQLAKEKKNKYDLGRDEFEKKVWEWANSHRGKIENQMKLLGCSADWSKSEFTLNPGYVKAVRTTFFELFKQGLIYQGTRLINWCPHCLTSLSDLEVIHEDRTGKLYKIKYELVQPDLSPSLRPSGTSLPQGEKGGNTDLLPSPFMGEGLGMGVSHLVVATSRPETLFGDVAVAINPEDIRYKSLIDLIKQGQAVKVKLPLTGKEIPVILSEAVKLDFGTGALKITPAHDFNDQEISKEWNANPLAALSEGTLEPINIFNEKAQLLPLEFIPAELHGLERFKAREAVLKILGEQELLLEEEKYSQAAALHDRCGNVIEPYLSKQWFVNMKPLAKLAINAYTPQPPSKGEQEDLLRVKFFPERYGKTYLDWLENIQDWCISRQLWWGHPIPVWSKPLDLTALNDSQKAEEMHGSIVNEFKRLSKEAGYTNKPTLRSDAHHPSFVIGDKKDNEYIFQYGVESAQVVLLGSDEAFEKVLELAGYKKDNDVLDTWFSSALWPFATLGWPDTPQPLYKGEAPNEKKKPWTSILMTAREIINLWVSRMIFSALKMTDRLPFTDILIHPVLQTPDGKRMSKSKGNAIDPIELVNKYGADASRLWYCSVGIFANQDTRFPGKKEKDGSWSSPELENKRRFINKLWNATKFVLQNTGELPPCHPELVSGTIESVRKNIDQVVSELAINQDKNTANLWILGRWNEVLKEANEHLKNYRFAEFSKSLEDFVWDDFCDWYLELAKIDFSGNVDSTQTKQTLIYILEQVLRAFHPIIPFVSEEIWQTLTGEQSGLAFAEYPQAIDLTDEQKQIDNSAKTKIRNFKELITTIRSIRQNMLLLPASTTLDVYCSLEAVRQSQSIDSWNWEKLYFGEMNWRNFARVNENPSHSLKNGSFNQFINLAGDQEGISLTVLVSIPESVKLEVLEESHTLNRKKKFSEFEKLKTQFNNPGFAKNASEETKAEKKMEINKLLREIGSIQEALDQIKEASRFLKFLNS